MKKLLLSLLVLPVFLGITWAYNCSTVYDRMKVVIDRYDEIEYKTKVLKQRQQYVSNSYEAQALIIDIENNLIENDRLLAESSVLQEEQKRCESQGNTYNDYLKRGDEYYEKVKASPSYDKDSVDNALYRYYKAYDLAYTAKFKEYEKKRTAIKKYIDKLEEYQKWAENEKAEAEKQAKQQQAELKAKQEKEEAEAELKEFNEAEKYLWKKASAYDWILNILRNKDKATQDKIMKLSETFKSSKDKYTRSVGIYMIYKRNH